ncbi:Histidinol dehydrogenase [Fundidesulfovibrio magnetotacticus]|uniref:Histidinol dehydrogenase n=1 Tax=Fundidesulfovibrio magnetotacticus TaxID=2730080 RepID=A0A6V8LW43_9BACT|nr:histidinol dehydrogenase [Fundidesulfovibrio magnetotacticus]GFK94538.1 Histidinol dehydrogenase [Fundidesulfovibrio magnetotacticus]
MPCPRIVIQRQADFDPLLAKLKGREDPGQDVEARVRDILAYVQAQGDEALADFNRRFDCPSFAASMLRVPEAEIQAAESLVIGSDLAIIREAAANIRAFHERQKQNSWWTTGPDGVILGQMVRPVDSVGLYVPGGQGGETPLISSLLMNAIPAQVAGVERIAAISPPRADGTLNPYILAAAAILGIREVYRVGSAWGIAALAFGTRTIPSVDVIAGPGNMYVTTAKRLLVGQVGIDMIAGPSEIVILADKSAPAAWLAADMLSQAEHDPLAASILVTDSPAQADAVLAALRDQLERLPRAEIARRSLAQWGAVVVAPDMDEALAAVNRLAPEHLELAVEDGWGILGRIRHAGAIFLGAGCPEPVGDYFAGPNHVLPTMGNARFSSALSVETFIKKSSLIAAPPSYARRHGAKIARLARLEGLEAHARSVECRNE